MRSSSLSTLAFIVPSLFLVACLVPNPLHLAEEEPSAGGAGTGGQSGGSVGGTAGSSGNAGSEGGASGSGATGGSSGGGSAGLGGSTGGSSGGGNAGVAGTGGSAGNAGVAGNTAGTGGTGGSTSRAKLRVAHFSPDTAAVQFCSRPSGIGNFQLHPVTDLPDSGLPYGLVSAYLYVDAGVVDIALVAQGSNSCVSPLVQYSGLVLDSNSMHTVMLSGKAANSSLRIKDFEDHDAIVSGAAQIRVIHGSPAAGPFTLGSFAGLLAGTGYTNWTNMFQAVTYDKGIGEIGSVANLDSLGYKNVGVNFPTDMAIELRSATKGERLATFLLPDAGVSLGVNATWFVYEDGTGSPNLLQCYDLAEPLNKVSHCAVATYFPGNAPPQSSGDAPAPLGAYRFGHMSPEPSATSVDVCLKPSYYPTWTSGPSQAIVSDLKYKQVTGDIELPFPEYYDIKYVAHTPNGTADCSKSAISATADLTAQQVLQSTQTTWAAIGKTASPNYPISLVSMVHAAQSSGLYANMRYAHAIVGILAADVGFVVGQPFVWSGIGFGDASAYSEVNLLAGQLIGLNYQSTSSFDTQTGSVPAAKSTSTGHIYTLWGVGDIAVAGGHLMVLCDEDPSATIQTCSEFALNP